MSLPVWEVARRLKADSQKKYIPIIAIAITMADNREKPLRLAAMTTTRRRSNSIGC